MAMRTAPLQKSRAYCSRSACSPRTRPRRLARSGLRRPCSRPSRRDRPERQVDAVDVRGGMMWRALHGDAAGRSDGPPIHRASAVRPATDRIRTSCRPCRARRDRAVGCPRSSGSAGASSQEGCAGETTPRAAGVGGPTDRCTHAESRPSYAPSSRNPRATPCVQEHGVWRAPAIALSVAGRGRGFSSREEEEPCSISGVCR